MNSSKAQMLLSQIDSTFADIQKVSGQNYTVDSFLAQFLVVYLCGMYEETIETILVEFVSRHTSQPEIVAYARDTIDQNFRNPDSKKIIELMSKLGNNVWVNQIKQMHNERVALDSIVANKNNIAHGRGSVITLADVAHYYSASRPLIEMIDTLFV